MQFDVTMAEEHAKELLPKDHPQNRADLYRQAGEMLQDLQQRPGNNDAVIFATLQNWIFADNYGGNDETDRYQVLLIARDVMQSRIVQHQLERQGYVLTTGGNYPEYKKEPADIPGELEQKAALFKKCVQMTADERAAYIDTGCFNSYIQAYMCLVLREMGKDDAEIVTAKQMLKNMLEDYRAADAEKTTGEQ